MCSIHIIFSVIADIQKGVGVKTPKLQVDKSLKTGAIVFENRPTFSLWVKFIFISIAVGKVVLVNVPNGTKMTYLINNCWGGSLESIKVLHLKYYCKNTINHTCNRFFVEIDGVSYQYVQQKSFPKTKI